MVSSLTGMLEHAKFNLKFHWGLGYNLQNASPFQGEEGGKSQITSNEGMDQWKQYGIFARRGFNFCLLCLLYDLGYITKLETNFCWRGGLKKNRKQERITRKKWEGHI